MHGENPCMNRFLYITLIPSCIIIKNFFELVEGPWVNLYQGETRRKY